MQHHTETPRVRPLEALAVAMDGLTHMPPSAILTRVLAAVLAGTLVLVAAHVHWWITAALALVGLVAVVATTVAELAFVVSVRPDTDA